MSCESYDLRLTTLSPIHIGSGKSYNCCEFVPAKAKSKGQIVKIIKRVNLTNYYSSLSDDRKDTFLASLTNSNFELKQFDKKIKKDFVRYQCIDNSRVDFINEVQEHIKTSDKLYIPGSSIKGAIRTAIFYDLLTEEDMDKIGRDISSNRRNNSFLSNDLLKKHFTSGFGNDAQYNIFRFMQVADTTTTNLPRIEQVLAVMATDDRRKNQFYSRHGKVVKSYLETIGANKNLEELMHVLFKKYFIDNNPFYVENDEKWNIIKLKDLIIRNRDKINDFDNWKDELLIDLSNMPRFSIAISNFDKGKKFTSNIYKLNKYDLLFGSIRPYFGKVGFSPINGVVTGTVHSFKPIDDIYYSLVLSLISSKTFINYTVSVSKGTKMPSVKWDDFINYEFAIPDDLSKIGEYNKILLPLIHKIEKNILEIQRLTKLRDTLLPKLMSGEIDVSKINCDLELKYNYMKYLFNQIHTPMSKSVV